jgi:colicin import membrane protein
MPAAADRSEFAPPPQPGLVRAFILAIAAHLLLMIALTWGINWNRETENVAAEAELWSRVPQEAAPALVQPPPAPPAPAAPPAPPPTPVAAPTPPPAPVNREADIALEREKIRQQQAERRQEELERQKKLEARKKQEELEREKKLEARKKQEELRREQLAEQKAADEKLKRSKQELAKAKARQDDVKVAELRKEQLDRMKGLAGATGDAMAKGTAQRSAGPSDSYAGRIRARVRPNIVFTEDISGNPTAEVEVNLAPDGTITSRRLLKSSGAAGWDQAVLRALDKTEVLPRDVDGRVHSPLILEFKPKI